MLLVTNSHQFTLYLKDEVTGLVEYFDGVHTSHEYGYAKEHQNFWHALHEDTGFDSETTMFVDDNHAVLQSKERKRMSLFKRERLHHSKFLVPR